MDLFPEIGLEKLKLLTQCTSSCLSPLLILKQIATRYNFENRKKFFEDYAKQNGFDPYNPVNWYTQPRENIMSVKVGKAIMIS
jgi:hypothetical protein